MEEVATLEEAIQDPVTEELLINFLIFLVNIMLIIICILV